MDLRVELFKKKKIKAKIFLLNYVLKVYAEESLNRSPYYV